MMIFYLLITKFYVNNNKFENVKVKYCIFENRVGNNTLFHISLYITEFLQLLIFQFIDFL